MGQDFCIDPDLFAFPANPDADGVSRLRHRGPGTTEHVRASKARGSWVFAAGGCAYTS